MPPSHPSILIAVLRNDLRIVDHSIFHPAHFESLASRITHILPVYIFDDRQIELGSIKGYTKATNQEARTPIAKFWKCNVHRTRFLHESIVDLKQTLENLGSTLSTWFGQPERVIPAIVKAYKDQNLHIEGVWMARENTSEEIQTQDRLAAALQKIGSSLHLAESRRTLIHPDDLPFDPSGKAMPDFYTAFRQKVEGLRESMVRSPLPAPQKFKPPPDANLKVEAAPGIMSLPSSTNMADVLAQLLEPIRSQETERPASQGKMHFAGGCTVANQRLDHYTTGPKAPLATYKDTRNGLLGADFSTKFSPWLANGTLSPKSIFAKVLQWEEQYGANKSSYWVKFELLWRDYFSFLIEKHGNRFFFLSGLGLPQQEAPIDVGNPRSVAQVHKGGKPTIDGYWLPNDASKGDKSDVMQWCHGHTGIPFIDANMRELTRTGYMSNRGRQNVASFFTKDMGHYDWRIGAEYFESMLLDYDVTSNYGNWQYQAGVGVDPRNARQFNIIKQGKDYDAQGEYVAHWLPELASILRKHDVPLGSIHHPWTVDMLRSDLQASPDLRAFSTGHFEQKAWISHYRRSPREEGSQQSGGARDGRGGSSRKGNPGPRGGQHRHDHKRSQQAQPMIGNTAA